MEGKILNFIELVEKNTDLNQIDLLLDNLDKASCDEIWNNSMRKNFNFKLLLLIFKRLTNRFSKPISLILTEATNKTICFISSSKNAK